VAFVWYFWKSPLTLGEQLMTAKIGKDVAKSGAKSPYPFRTGWALLLLAINFLVAAYYFNIIQ
jgi:photosystem I 4.8kDa protein